MKNITLSKAKKDYERFKSLKTLMTHSGVFHADDVFSTALLRIITGHEVPVSRVFKVPENINDDTDGVIIYDIGGGKFDHHQADGECRPSGIKYAAFGLLWREYGYFLVDDPEECERFDASFVSIIDSTDNGGEMNPLSAIIADKNPTWEEAKSLKATDEAFEDAVNLAVVILRRKINIITSRISAREKVKADIAWSKKNLDQAGEIILLSGYYPYLTEVCPIKNTLYVIFEGNRGDGSWNIRAVPKTPESRDLRAPIRTDASSLYDGCTFVHPTGFLAACKSKEAAIDLAFRLRTLYHGNEEEVVVNN